jgi:histone H3/H4
MSDLSRAAQKKMVAHIEKKASLIKPVTYTSMAYDTYANTFANSSVSAFPVAMVHTGSKVTSVDLSKFIESQPTVYVILRDSSNGLKSKDMTPANVQAMLKPLQKQSKNLLKTNVPKFVFVKASQYPFIIPPSLAFPIAAFHDASGARQKIVPIATNTKSSKRTIVSSQKPIQKKMKMLNNNQRSNLTGGHQSMSVPSKQQSMSQSKQQQGLTPEPIRKTVVPRNKTGKNNRNTPYLSKTAIVHLIRRSGWDQVSVESRNTIQTLLDTLIRCALNTTNIPGPPYTNDFVIRPWNLEEIIKRLTNGPVSENVVQRIHPIVEGHLVSILKQSRDAHKNKKRLQSHFITDIPLPAWCHNKGRITSNNL